MDRPDPKYIARLKVAIRAMHGCGARYFTTIPVTEMDDGEVAWQGDVEVFDLLKHPEAQTCYAWSDKAGNPPQTVAILGVPPVVSAEAAVKVVFARSGRKAPRRRAS